MFSSQRREGDWRRHSVQGLALKRKPSFVGMMTVLLSKEMPSLVHATNSEQLLPEATATRKMVFEKKVFQGGCAVPKSWGLETGVFQERDWGTIWKAFFEWAERDRTELRRKASIREVNFEGLLEGNREWVPVAQEGPRWQLLIVLEEHQEF